MLKIYFSSVLIWMVIIFGITFMFKQSIKDKGWIDESKKSKNWIVVLFCIASIPIFRALVAAGLLFMAATTKEDYQKENNKDE